MAKPRDFIRSIMTSGSTLLRLTDEQLEEHAKEIAKVDAALDDILYQLEDDDEDLEALPRPRDEE